MNNFFLNQDPLLNGQPPQQQVIFPQVPQQSIKDFVGELDKALKGLTPTVTEKLSQNARFASLNTSFQSNVQKEILQLVKNRLNTDQNVISNINEQIRIIEEVKKGVEDEKEASLNEMNDYMKNYSHLTFDEYKKMKNGEQIDKKKK